MKPEYIKLDTSIRFRPGNVGWEQKLGAYYQDFSEAIKNFESNQFGQFDNEGLPMDDFGTNAIYNPVYLAQYGLIQHDFLVKGNQKGNDEVFKKVLIWFIDNKKQFKDSFVWPFQKKNIKYSLEPGWVSGMYQGQIISLLLRGYQYYGDSAYLEHAQIGFEYFKYGYEDGGVCRRDEDGNFWIEEYPTKTPSFVLNGFIYALFGIIDYYRITESAVAKQYIDEIHKTLIKCTDKYDLGYWSVYDQQKCELVSSYYQINIHVVLMEILSQLFEEKLFKKYADKWRANYNNSFYRHVLVPIMYRIQPRIKKWR